MDRTPAAPESPPPKPAALLPPRFHDRGVHHLPRQFQKHPVVPEFRAQTALRKNSPVLRRRSRATSTAENRSHDRALRSGPIPAAGPKSPPDRPSSPAAATRVTHTRVLADPVSRPPRRVRMRIACARGCAASSRATRMSSVSTRPGAQSPGQRVKSSSSALVAARLLLQKGVVDQQEADLARTAPRAPTRL
mgnify:CR=1 FL=1